MRQLSLTLRLFLVGSVLVAASGWLALQQVQREINTGAVSGSYLDYRTVRPQYVANFDGNYFAANRLGADHEFKFGFQYKKTPIDSFTTYGGDVFANYDGVEKHRTSVGRYAKTGSNNTFVAPVTIGDGAGTAGGTVVRRDVPPGALAVSSGPQRNIPGWVQRRRTGTAQAEAAEAASRDTGPEVGQRPSGGEES